VLPALVGACSVLLPPSEYLSLISSPGGAWVVAAIRVPYPFLADIGWSRDFLVPLLMLSPPWELDRSCGSGLPALLARGCGPVTSSAGPARGRPPAPLLADHQPTPSTYSATAAIAPGHAAGPGAARTGRGRLRLGRQQASATAPSCSRGRARCHPLEPGGSGRVGHTLHVGTDTGRRASPARPGPWGVTRGVLVPGVGSPLSSRRWPPWIAQQSVLPAQGCCVWIAGSFVTVGTADSIRLSPCHWMPPGPPAGALDRRDVSPPRARRQSPRAVRWGGPGPLPPRVDRRGLRH
jgi:hypothetical protein